MLTLYCNLLQKNHPVQYVFFDVAEITMIVFRRLTILSLLIAKLGKLQSIGTKLIS